MDELANSLLKRTLGQWDTVSYPVRCAVKNREADAPRESKRRKLDTELIGEQDVDEWIIRNERALRDVMSNSADSPNTPWSHGLVRLSSHMNTVLPNSSVSAISRVITRHAMTGFTVLDSKRAERLFIQPSVDAFAKTFSEMTQDILKGLDWTNICVAGGIALGALLSVDDPLATSSNPGQWKDSDIDIYIHGLDPLAANEKIRHIFSVFQSNLPTGHTTMVRNAKTINFLSQYPTRRLQIVLKKVWNPKEVLLNFDLDICAVGYDGAEVWMLPRAVRALETGYNVFTMDIIQGHYLGDRRATQEARVFKYADRGFGIRILPSYVEHASVQTINQKAKLGRKYTNMLAKVYLQQQTIPSLQQQTIPSLQQQTIPSHVNIGTGDQRSPEPQGVSCLSGLELFMRHVVLWEGEAKGEWEYDRDNWMSTEYPDGFGGYDDSPKYTWDSNFTFEAFQMEIDKFNHTLGRNLGFQIWDQRRVDVNIILKDAVERDRPSLARIRYASDVNTAIAPENDLVIPLMAPIGFLEFAAEVLQAVHVDHCLSNANEVDQIATLDEKGPPHGEALAFWRIGTFSMWQLVDRRMDEIHELLWNFHRAEANEEPGQDNIRLRLIQNQISRRSVRKAKEDELTAFKAWVNQEPVRDSGDVISSNTHEEFDWNYVDRSGDEDEDAGGDDGGNE